MAKTTSARSEQPKATKTTKITRKYKSQQDITHDLYKLEVAQAVKNIAWEPGIFTPQKVEHCHFFHSVDKNGAPQTKCSPIGGHFHELELVTAATDESPAVYRCSPAKKFVLKRRPNGEYYKAVVDIPHDSHSHDVTYIESHDFKPSKLNAEAVKLMGQVDKKPDPVPGIVG